MAKQENNYSYLNCLTVDKLEELLQIAVNAQSEEDSEYVDAILEVIVRKERGNPTGKISDIDQAWKEFQAYYNTQDGQGQSLYCSEETEVCQPQSIQKPINKPKHRILRPALIAAAIVVLLAAMLTVPVFGYANIFQMIGQWSAEQFSFRMVGSNSENIDALQSRDIPKEYVVLQAELAQRGIDSLAVPSHLPEGFQLAEQNLYISPDTGYVESVTAYEKEQDTIVLAISQPDPQRPIIYEKTAEDVEIFDCHGIEYYIFNNARNITATWYFDRLEYSISTTLPISALKEMIESI